MSMNYVSVCLLCLVLNGCTAGTEKDIRSVTETIARYNQLLSKGYAEMNMTPLQQVATGEQAEREYFHMAALGEARVRMEPELKSLDVREIEFASRNNARVVTDEVWDYNHINIDTQKRTKSVRNIGYTLTYTVVRGNGTWLVSSVLTLKNTPPRRK